MLGQKKEKVPFGQRKSKGSFGSKPSKSSFGNKPPAKPLGSKTATLKARVLEKNIPKQQERLRAAKPTKSMFEKPSKPMKKKAKKNLATPEEREFMDWIHSEAQYLDYPCFVCGKLNSNDTIEWHHAKEFSSDKKNHKRQIPLCGNLHHRGTKTTDGKQELSPHGTPVKFREKYPIDDQWKYADSIWNDFQNYKKGI